MLSLLGESRTHFSSSSSSSSLFVLSSCLPCLTCFLFLFLFFFFFFFFVTFFFSPCVSMKAPIYWVADLEKSTFPLFHFLSLKERMQEFSRRNFLSLALFLFFPLAFVDLSFTVVCHFTQKTTDNSLVFLHSTPTSSPSPLKI